MPKIVILRGNSGSGKSTVGKALQRKIGRGTLLVSQDYVRREMLWVKDRPNNQAADLLEQLIVYGHQNSEITILDGILTAYKYENLFNRIKYEFKENIFAYYFDLPFEETLKRHGQRSKTHDFGEPEMREWWRAKDFLPDIREKMIYKEMSLEEIVEQIYEDIQDS